MAKYFSKSIEVALGGYLIGSATTRIDVIIDAEALDITAFQDSGERVTPGIRRDEVRMGGYFDDGTSIDLAGPSAVGTLRETLSVVIGSAEGSRVYAGTGMLTIYTNPGAIAGIVAYDAVYKPDGSLKKAQFLSKFTTLVFTANGESTNSGSLDNGAATTAGGTLFAHLTAVAAGGTAGTQLQFQLQDSADGVSFANVDSVTLSTVTATALALSGTIRRYIRGRYVEGTAGTGTFSFIASFFRG